MGIFCDDQFLDFGYTENAPNDAGKACSVNVDCAEAENGEEKKWDRKVVAVRARTWVFGCAKECWFYRAGERGSMVVVL
jgi:hypothetical protein